MHKVREAGGFQHGHAAARGRAGVQVLGACLPVGGFPLPSNPQAAKGTDVHTAQPKRSHPALALKAAVSQHGQASFPSWSSLISLGVECDPPNVSTALGFGFKCTEELGPYSLWDFRLGVLGIDLPESHSNTTSGN